MGSSSFFVTIGAAAIGLFMLFRNLRFRQEDNKEENSSSSSSSSSPQSPTSPSSSLNRIGTHHVFPSFRGEDVRRDFLSHIQMEFQRNGITPFIDNEIKRGESIGLELIRAIRESKIAIILLSKNYASSSWCLDELAEIMKCREDLGQMVMVVFYKVDPSDVKKLTGDFGKVFRKTCSGKTKEVIARWRQALATVATIAGYHSINWDNEAAMIKKIATDISNKLNNSALSRDFDGLVGMRYHLKKMESLLCLDSDEVRMVGIWGPPGIGKTTIARFAYNNFSNSFQLSVFVESIEAKYTRPCSDDYSAKLHLQQQFMSQITNQNDMKISHLGVVQDRLKDKKVLVVLDGVDQSMQLDAMAKETWWFGPGSRIIITTQDRKLFREHGIDLIYEVDFPPTDEALQILCMYAFGQNSPKHGFEKLAQEVTKLAGELPLGLRVMGSYFRGMSKLEWEKALPRLRSSLDTNIQSILKFSYDALDDEDKDLFLHIACFFNYNHITKVEELLAETFLDVSHGLIVLAEKSLISIEYEYVKMHNLLAQLGRDIVRKQSPRAPGQRLFLVDAREICEVLNLDANGSASVIGIDFNFGKNKINENFHISERAFKGMSNLQFLRFNGDHDALHLPCGLDYLSRKLRLLHWEHFPMTYLPSIVNSKFLVVLDMRNSKLEKLWEGIKPLPNLKWMDLSSSRNLKELPDLSTATNLQQLNLSHCLSLVKLPSSIDRILRITAFPPNFHDDVEKMRSESAIKWPVESKEVSKARSERRKEASRGRGKMTRKSNMPDILDHLQHRSSAKGKSTARPTTGGKYLKNLHPPAGWEDDQEEVGASRAGSHKPVQRKDKEKVGQSSAATPSKKRVAPETRRASEADSSKRGRVDPPIEVDHSFRWQYNRTDHLMVQSKAACADLFRYLWRDSSSLIEPTELVRADLYESVAQSYFSAVDATNQLVQCYDQQLKAARKEGSGVEVRRLQEALEKEREALKKEKERSAQLADELVAYQADFEERMGESIMQRTSLETQLRELEKVHASEMTRLRAARDEKELSTRRKTTEELTGRFQARLDKMRECFRRWKIAGFSRCSWNRSLVR